MTNSEQSMLEAICSHATRWPPVIAMTISYGTTFANRRHYPAELFDRYVLEVVIGHAVLNLRSFKRSLAVNVALDSPSIDP